MEFEILTELDFILRN